MIDDFVGLVVGSFIGGWIGDNFIQRKQANATKRGIFLGGMRVQAGSQRGLTREWLVGEWRIRRGRLSMADVDIVIKETVTGSKRSGGLNEIVGGKDTTVVLVRTETAVLEWSMLRRFDGLALRALSVPESTTGP
jgi:hypothetical protein